MYISQLTKPKVYLNEAGDEGGAGAAGGSAGGSDMGDSPGSGNNNPPSGPDYKAMYEEQLKRQAEGDAASKAAEKAKVEKEALKKAKEGDTLADLAKARTEERDAALARLAEFEARDKKAVEVTFGNLNEASRKKLETVRSQVDAAAWKTLVDLEAASGGTESGDGDEPGQPPRVPASPGVKQAMGKYKAKFADVIEDKLGIEVEELHHLEQYIHPTLGKTWRLPFKDFRNRIQALSGVVSAPGSAREFFGKKGK